MPCGLAPDAEFLAQKGFIAPGQVADGANAQLPELPLKPAAHIEHGAHRQRPDQLLHLCAGKDGGGVRLFVVAAQLGEGLAEGDAYGDGDARFLVYLGADLVGHGLCVTAEQVKRAGQVEIAFVNAGRFHQVGVAQEDLVHLMGDLGVELTVRSHQHQPRTFALGLPDGLRRLYFAGLGQLVFGQNNAVTAFPVTGHCHGYACKFRAEQAFAGGKKVVAVHMENDPLHQGFA